MNNSQFFGSIPPPCRDFTELTSLPLPGRLGPIGPFGPPSPPQFDVLNRPPLRHIKRLEHMFEEKTKSPVEEEEEACSSPSVFTPLNPMIKTKNTAMRAIMNSLYILPASPLPLVSFSSLGSSASASTPSSPNYVYHELNFNQLFHCDPDSNEEHAAPYSYIASFLELHEFVALTKITRVAINLWKCKQVLNTLFKNYSIGQILSPFNSPFKDSPLRRKRPVPKQVQQSQKRPSTWVAHRVKGIDTINADSVFMPNGLPIYPNQILDKDLLLMIQNSGKKLRVLNLNNTCPMIFSEPHSELKSSIIDVLELKHKTLGRPTLEELYLSHTTITDKDLIAMANSPAFGELRILDLSDCEFITINGLLALANSPYIKKIETLILPKIVIGQHTLFNSENWSHLKHLTLDLGSDVDSGVESGSIPLMQDLASSAIIKLNSLSLKKCSDLNDAVAELIIASTTFSEITSLKIEKALNSVVSILLNSNIFKLTVLHLIDIVGLTLDHIGNVSGLQSLKINNLHSHDEIIGWINQQESLEELDLQGSNLNSEALRTLLNVNEDRQNLQKLTSINITGCRCDDEFLNHLARSELPKLTHVSLTLPESIDPLSDVNLEYMEDESMSFAYTIEGIKALASSEKFKLTMMDIGLSLTPYYDTIRDSWNKLIPNPWSKFKSSSIGSQWLAVVNEINKVELELNNRLLGQPEMDDTEYANTQRFIKLIQAKPAIGNI